MPILRRSGYAKSRPQDRTTAQTIGPHCVRSTAVGCVRPHSPPRPQKLNLVNYCVHDETVFTHYDNSASFGTGTFRAQDLSFPRTNSPYGELSFPKPFVPGNFRSLGMEVLRSLNLSFGRTFVHRTFRSQELSFPRPFCKALAMNRFSVLF